MLATLIMIRIVKDRKRGYIYDTSELSKKRENKNQCLAIFEKLVYFICKESGWAFDYGYISKGFGEQSTDSACGVYVLAILKKLFGHSEKIQSSNEYVVNQRLKMTVEILTDVE